MDNPFEKLKDEVAQLQKERANQRLSLLKEYDEIVRNLLQSISDTFQYNGVIYPPVVNPTSNDNFLEWKLKEKYSYSMYNDEILTIKLALNKDYKPDKFYCTYLKHGPAHGKTSITGITEPELTSGLIELLKQVQLAS